MEIVSLRPPSTKALGMRHRWVGVCVCVCVGGGGTVIAHAHTNVFPPWLWRSGRHFPYGVWTPGHNIIRMTVLNYRHPFMVFYSVPITIIVNFNLTELI